MYVRNCVKVTLLKFFRKKVMPIVFCWIREIFKLWFYRIIAFRTTLHRYGEQRDQEWFQGAPFHRTYNCRTPTVRRLPSLPFKRKGSVDYHYRNKWSWILFQFEFQTLSVGGRFLKQEIINLNAFFKCYSYVIEAWIAEKGACFFLFSWVFRLKSSLLF